jgi:uncharacterized protein (TIGR02246 family)
MEQEIRDRFVTFADAWNAHDVEAMAACWVENGNVTHPWGTFAAGRDGVARLLADEHTGPMRDSHYRFDQLQVRALSGDAAVVECDGVIEQVRAPNGNLYALPHRLNAVLVRAEAGRDEWRFMSLNPSVTRARG